MAKIKELQKKYSLSKDDFWNLTGNVWVIKHDAVEKIAKMENVIFENPTIVEHSTLNTNESTSTIGEASSSNCMSKYIGCMAEKRGIGRAILKLINAYQYGIASEVEADDFKKDKPKKTWTKTNIEQGKVEDLL